MNKTIRTLGALTLAALLAWPAAARADVTLTGTVQSIATVTNNYIRFNFSDPNQTAACLDGGQGAKYAYFPKDDFNYPFWREWFTMLLVSKKGATINCVVTDAKNCTVKSCELP